MLRRYSFDSTRTFKHPYSSRQTAVLGVFLGVFLLGLFACGEGPVPNCSSSFVASSTSTCMPPSGPKATAGVTPIAVKPIPPTPTPSPIPTPSPTPSPSTPTPSPTLPIDYKSLVHDETINYYQLIMHGLYSAAYAILSAERQAQLSLLQFEANPNYSLSSQVCWHVYGVTNVIPLDNRTWADGVQLAQVSCTDGTLIASFYWSFRWQMQQNHLVIIAIGLYPTAPSN